MSVNFINKMNLPRAIILRGVSGSGKSTIATILRQCAGYRHFEADQYFYKWDSQQQRMIYAFDKTQLKEAHKWCLARVVASLKSGDNVVVANTFTRLWELEPYLTALAELGVTPTVLHAESAFQSIHAVPKETIEAQRARWEPLK